MARKLAVRRCDTYKGVTIEQVKKFLMRRSAGHAYRIRALPHSIFRQSGRKVISTNSKGGWTATYECNNGHIVGYAGYDDDD